MRYIRIIGGSLLLVLVASLTFLQPGSKIPFVPDNASRTNSAAQPGAQAVGEVVVSEPVVPVLTMPARDVPDSQPEPRLDREINPRIDPYGRTDPAVYIEGGLDPLVALQANAPAASDRDFDTPIFNFEGQGYTFLNPPDTVGDVGIDHYVQMINATEVAVYDKDTAALIDTFSLTSLGGCATGGGDPIVLYDEAADRWLLSEFGPGNSLCVFISQTADPLGAYYSYQFSTPNFPDYPKYGVWTDAYYVTTNESSPANYALDRDAMLAGNPATSQRFTAPDLSGFGFQALTPADVDGPPPPAGSPGYFMRHRDTEAHGPAGFPTEDFLEVWAFDVDWDNPANSTFTQVANISVTEFDSHICSLTAFSGIPMPGAAKCASNSLDPIREVVMFRLQYRNFGGYETLVGNLVTDATGSDDAGLRWFELRKSGANPWSLYQEGTYFPGDGNGRWMGAIAMDASGNIALGYNVSGPSVFPSLRYAGRLASDPLGTLPQGEYEIVSGSGNNSSNRYGDYAAMSVDPEDGCTFWFTGEYNPSSQWSTRIAAFKFASCGGPFHVEATPPSLDICTPDDAVYSVHVALDIPGFSDPVDLDVLGEPAGTTATFSVDNQVPPYDSTLTIGNTGVATPGNYSLSITGSGPTSTVTTTVGLNLFNAAATVSLVSPADGAVDTPIAPTFEWSGTGTSYTIEIATDPAFNDIVETDTVEGTTYTSSGLDPESTYYWRVLANNICGGGASETWSFTTMGVPPILLVDDDDNSPNVQATYTAALDALGLEYDVWDTANTDNEPSAAQLAPYEVVIWFTGDEFGGAAGPGSTGEAALSTWLDGGGCLFISSQDYHYDRGLTAFMSNYLGVASVTNDNGDYTSVTGQGVFSGLGPYTLSYPFSDFSDVINPNGTAQLAFNGNNGNGAAISKDGGAYRTTFWVFPWEAIGTAANREAALQAVLDWCGELPAYDVDLSGNQSAEGQPGETVEYTVTVTNEGNVTDVINLAVSGESWTTTLSVSSVELGPGESTDITVSVEIPGDAQPGDSDTATVTGTSTGNPAESDSMTVTTSVPEEQPEYGVDVSGDTSGSGLPGDVVSYEVTVTNTGSNADTFDLVVSGNAWTTTLSEESVALGAGESVVVTVEVTIPGDASDGDADTVTITATSTGDPGVSDSHDITTTATTTPPVPEYKMFLPVMLKQP